MFTQQVLDQLSHLPSSPAVISFRAPFVSDVPTRCTTYSGLTNVGLRISPSWAQTGREVSCADHQNRAISDNSLQTGSRKYLFFQLCFHMLERGIYTILCEQGNDLFFKCDQDFQCLTDFCMSGLHSMYSYCRSTTCCRPGGRNPRTRAPLSLSTALIQSFVHLPLYSRNNGIISVPCHPLRTLLKLTKLVSKVFISSLCDQERF